MCGRFAQFSPSIPDKFGIGRKGPGAPELPLLYNAAPTDTVYTVVGGHDRSLIQMRWGLVTPWSAGGKYSLINIRDDNLRKKDTFAQNLESYRCLIPADGFYEWKRDMDIKTPYFFRMKNGEPFAFAGIWNSEMEIRSCAIITTSANELMSLIHDRMPVILPGSLWEEWLDNGHFDRERILSLLAPFSSEEMEAYRVSERCNSSKYKESDCIKKTGHFLTKQNITGQVPNG